MSESIVQLVFFVAVVAVTGLFAGTLITQSAILAQSVDRDGERSAAELDAEIVLVTDEAVDAYDADNETVTLYVKNVGGSTLEPASLDVLVDGEYVESPETSVVDGERWRVGTVLEVRADASLDPGTHRVLVRIHGATDRSTFEHQA